MAGLSSTLDIAKNTLLNQQLLIQTASHNIANAENTAYARQKADLLTNPPTRTQAGWAGSGARIDTITQVRDRYLEQQLMASTTQASDYRTRASYLGTLGSCLNDTGEVGISAELGAFWDAWDALSQNPTGIVEQQGVISAAQDLAGTFNTTQTNLTTMQETTRSTTSDTVDQINSLLDRIADYNYSIVGMESGGHAANDLRDLRYQALMDLSEQLGVSYTEEANGAVTVSLQDGSDDLTLVSNFDAGELAYDEGTDLIAYTQADGSTVSPDPNALSGGKLAGLLTTLQDITDVNERLDTLVDELATQVNGLYDGPYAVFTGTTMADIAVNPDFVDHPSDVSGVMAADLAELQNATFANLDDSRFIDYLGAIQEQIGLDQEDASSRAAFQEALAQQLQTQQQSVSGVSLDEEMINLLKYQQVYQAAAKIVETTRSLLDTVIAMAD